MATNTWSAAAPGNWSTAGNWSLGHAPLAGEDVVYDSATSAQPCTVDVDPAANLASITTSVGLGSIAFGTHTVSVTGNVSMNGGTASGVWTVGGNFTLVAVATFNGTLTCTGAVSINSTATVTMGGDWDAGTFAWDSGNFVLNNHTLTVRGTLAMDPVLTSGICTLTGTIFVDPTALTFANIVRRHATSSITGLTIRVGTTAAVVLGLVSMGSETISRLICTGAGVGWPNSANIVTISNYAPGDWNNATWATDAPGTPWHLSAPSPFTVTGLNATDTHNAGAIVTVAGGTNGGGNEGFTWGYAMSPAGGRLEPFEE